MIFMVTIFILMVLVETAVSFYLNKGRGAGGSFFVRWRKMWNERKFNNQLKKSD